MAYSTTRGPLALCLAVFGFALLGICGYLIWLTVSEYVLHVAKNYFTLDITRIRLTPNTLARSLATHSTLLWGGTEVTL